MYNFLDTKIAVAAFSTNRCAAARTQPQYHAMPFAVGNDVQDQRWDNEYAELREHKDEGTTALSGRAWVVAVTHNLRSHFNVEHGITTIALCHLPLRMAAQPSDVVFFAATGPKAMRGPIGMSIPKRVKLLLACGIVEADIMLPSTYHGYNAPAWVKGRKDRAYICEVNGSGRRDKRGALNRLPLENPRVRAVVPHGKPAIKFVVRLANGTHLAYRCRERNRFHGPADISIKKRRKEFRGRILTMRSYACWPSLASHTESLKPKP